ncbi:MAG TPA: hypothetical protein VLA24_11520 [Pseudomonadales bacterium]|nr:hypothetical protein [Pseudomonadales bacterium]
MSENVLDRNDSAHDPLCPDGRAAHNKPLPSQCGWCVFASRVREDERQKAHNVIDRFDMFSDDREAMHAWIEGTPPDWWTETSNG